MRLDQTSNEISYLLSKISNNELDLQPGFQRGQVWGEQKKKRLIDTILRGWYVPPIHVVVNDDLDREEILDGQQRLRAILEFSNDMLPVDGKIEPHDNELREMDGLFFSQLPMNVRSRFKKFPLTTVRLRDYAPSEPGELFFRLNQISALTAAEQRNALVGAARNQIRALSEELDRLTGPTLLGFSNARMNYDDVLSRLAFTLEMGDLASKITASKLEERYRLADPFPQSIEFSVRHSINVLALATASGSKVRLNKATLFSWLYFIIDRRWPMEGKQNFHLFANLMRKFEYARSASGKNEENFQYLDDAYDLRRHARPLFSIFNDRSASRVNDTSSIVLRDFCLNAVLEWHTPLSGKGFSNQLLSLSIFYDLQALLRDADGNSERVVEDALLKSRWGTK